MDIPVQLLHFDAHAVWLVIFSLSLAILCAGCLMWVYEQTGRHITPPEHFIQSLVLMSVVTSMIMQSIGDSMARGFGIFGALAILRLRFNIRSPRDVAFIFATMGVGITSGVYSFITCIIGTVVFCLLAYVLRFSPLSKRENLHGELRFLSEKPFTDLGEISAILDMYCTNYSIRRYRVVQEGNAPPQLEYTCAMHLKKGKDGWQLYQALQTSHVISNIRCSFNDANPSDA
jgi:uncharacterized membrane protein YhiD involved in acid resistance